MKKILSLVIIAIAIGLPGRSQTASLSNIIANPGEDILVPLNFSGLLNVGAISLFIQYDTAVLTFNGITNISPEAAGMLANGMTSPVQVGLSWVAPGTSGVNFNDGKVLDLQFTYLGGSCSLIFPGYCEVVDWDLNLIPVVYTHGSVSSPAITLDLKVFLEGPYQTGMGGMMKTDLLNGGHIPLSQPFNPSLPFYGNPNPFWYYSGTESVTSIPLGVVDWVLVEIRDAASAGSATSATSEAKKALFLLYDGSIVDVDGVSLPEFDVTIDNGLFIVVFHRNHLPVINNNPITGTGNFYTYDFSAGAGQVFGGVNAHVEVEPGIFAMFGGDGNGDNNANNGDKINVWTVDVGLSGYLAGDFGVDGQCSNQDKVDVWVPNAGASSQVPN
ncbi:MAG: hypothetical protein JXA03_05260 [Bacteroidales bacterium]|nr:hypothetical protein [Bacteroidales bacterium]